MDYNEHLKIYKFLLTRVSNREAMLFNRIAEHRLPEGLTKNEYTTALLILVKGIPAGHLAKECKISEQAIKMRLSRGMKKLMCENLSQFKEEITRIEHAMNVSGEVLR